jgi:D-aminoacyl-tRNA deacylase
MDFAIIVSTKDMAGMNIKERLLETGVFKDKKDYFESRNIRLYTIEQETIHYEELEEEIEADHYIFATRHQSSSKEKTLSVHFPGNFGESKYGGKEREVCGVSPPMLKQAFLNLNELGSASGYKVTLESTHHGPYVKRPVMFIEIGSGEEEWQDEKAGKIIAEVILRTIAGFKEGDYEKALAFGGNHYCSGLNKIELQSNVALSHICPKHHIDSIDKDMIGKLVAASKGIDFALLDWKGMNAEQREKMVMLLDEMGIKWKKTKSI